MPALVAPDVVLRQFVILRTMGLAQATQADVLAMRHSLKMIWIDALMISAGVVDHHSLRNRTDKQLVEETVGRSDLLVPTRLSVAPVIQPSLPHPASINAEIVHSACIPSDHLEVGELTGLSHYAVIAVILACLAQFAFVSWPYHFRWAVYASWFGG